MTDRKTGRVTYVAAKDKTVKKYPANELKAPKKEFENTFSAVTALKQEFHYAT